MAVGTPIVGSDTHPVREFITHERTGLLTPFLAPDRLADNVLRLLEDTRLSQTLRANARRFAETHLDQDVYLANYTALIERLTGQSLRPAEAAVPRKVRARGR
jgi:glycosyltransferase involved in cell wall biosynthesis